MVTGPTSLVLLSLVSTLFGTTHEVVVGQFGPVIMIWALEVLKLLPLTVSEKVPAVTLLARCCGGKRRPGCRQFDHFDRVGPEPFCTWIVKLR